MASAQILNTGKAMYAWNGTNWIPLNSLNTVVNSTRWQKVAVGNETTLSGLDDNNNTLSYSPGYEQVFLNGILLVRGTDYTATNGTSITGLDPISAGANIEIIALKQINLANVYTKEQVDAAVQGQINNLIDSAPAALNTLNELAAALDDNADILDLYLTQSSASTQYEKLIPYSTSTPTSPSTGDMWVDSNSVPPALKVYNGSSWIQLGAAVDDSQAIIAGRMFA
jgi:hypothetical protein